MLHILYQAHHVHPYPVVVLDFNSKFSGCLQDAFHRRIRSGSRSSSKGNLMKLISFVAHSAYSSIFKRKLASKLERITFVPVKLTFLKGLRQFVYFEKLG